MDLSAVSINFFFDTGIPFFEGFHGRSSATWGRGTFYLQMIPKRIWFVKVATVVVSYGVTSQVFFHVLADHANVLSGKFVFCFYWCQNFLDFRERAILLFSPVTVEGFPKVVLLWVSFSQGLHWFTRLKALWP
jgi:hypothetical protein